MKRARNILFFYKKKYKKNYDVARMGRYTQNILQWNKNNIKSMRMTNGDYWTVMI